jgi:hypothetical protein
MVPKAFAPHALQEGHDDISTILCSHHPETTFFPHSDYPGCLHQMPIRKAPGGILSDMVKYDPNGDRRLDEHATQIACHWLIKALSLCFDDSLQVKVGMALAVKL